MSCSHLVLVSECALETQTQKDAWLWPMSSVKWRSAWVLSPCYIVTMLQCHKVTLSPGWIVTTLHCHHITVSPCYILTMLHCHHVMMSWCYNVSVTMRQYYSVTVIMSQCHHVTLTLTKSHKLGKNSRVTNICNRNKKKDCQQLLYCKEYSFGWKTKELNLRYNRFFWRS